MNFNGFTYSFTISYARRCDAFMISAVAVSENDGLLAEVQIRVGHRVFIVHFQFLRFLFVVS